MLRPYRKSGWSLCIPLPPFRELIEQGKVVALILPVGLIPDLPKTMAPCSKQDFQACHWSRAFQRSSAHPEKHWREALFLCDEYQLIRHHRRSGSNQGTRSFRIVSPGQMHPHCATQMLSSLVHLHAKSWRTSCRTSHQDILTLSDDFSARSPAVSWCGKKEQLENELLDYEPAVQDCKVRMLTGEPARIAPPSALQELIPCQRGNWLF